MSRLALSSLFLLVLLTAPPLQAEWPSWVERWLFNAGERTARGIEAADRGAAAGADEPLDTALRLEPDSAVTQYNAGTGRLAAGRTDAAPLLSTAAENAAPDLASRARYNLGNAQLEAGNLPAAVEAYKEALRADPGMEDAKHNLEYALRQLEQQQQQQQQQQEQDGEEQQDEQQQQQQQQQDGEEQQDEQQQQQQQQDGEEQQQQEQSGEEPQEQEGPLPQFEDLPDMTAEEAAAILEAVENLEREQRRKDAEEAAAVNALGKKDW